jgi:hypothetical protein
MHPRTALGVACLTLAVSTAAAEDTLPYSDLHGREPPVGDLVPQPLLPLGEPVLRPSVSLSLSLVERPTRRDVAGGIVLSFPTGALAAPRKAKSDEELVKDPIEEAPVEEALVRPPRRVAALPRVRSQDARAAVTAALRRRGQELGDERLDDLSARARYSAILPQVRLRATRLIDESQSVSPTSYDPGRTTSSGGVSLWLEARTTWYFDRLVFADEEVRIERMRRELSEAREALAERVIDLLFRWQRAAQRSRDPLTHPDACAEAVIGEQQLAVELDLLTGGWFARWLRRHPVEGLDCLERELDAQQDAEAS